jgi:hypothetical protein
VRRYHRDLEARRDRFRLERQMESMGAPPNVREFARVLLFKFDLEHASDWLERVAGVQDDPAAERRFAETAARVERRMGVSHILPTSGP